MQTALVLHATLLPHQLPGTRTRMQVASNIGLGDTDYNQVSHLIVVRSLGQVRELFLWRCKGRLTLPALWRLSAANIRSPLGRHLAKSLHNSMYVPPPNRC